MICARRNAPPSSLWRMILAPGWYDLRCKWGGCPLLTATACCILVMSVCRVGCAFLHLLQRNVSRGNSSKKNLRGTQIHGRLLSVSDMRTSTAANDVRKKPL